MTPFTCRVVCRFRRRLLTGACLLATINAFASADPAELLSQSVAARGAKNYSQAIELASAAIAAQPTSGEAFLARAFAHWSNKNTAAAVADFKAAVAADPTNPKAYLYRGDLAYRMIEGNYAACEADYATVLRLDPEFPSYRAYTAELYLYLRRPDRVIEEAVRGLLDEPTAPIHKINLAHGLAFAGQVAAAKAVYAAIAGIEVGHGRKGAAFALGDFTILKRKDIVYPQMAELTPFLEGLAKSAGASESH